MRLVEQGRLPAEIASEFKMSPEEADKLWYGIGTALLQAIEAGDGPPKPGA